MTKIIAKLIILRYVVCIHHYSKQTRFDLMHTEEDRRDVNTGAIKTVYKIKRGMYTHNVQSMLCNVIKHPVCNLKLGTDASAASDCVYIYMNIGQPPVPMNINSDVLCIHAIEHIMCRRRPAYNTVTHIHEIWRTNIHAFISTLPLLKTQHPPPPPPPTPPPPPPPPLPQPHAHTKNKFTQMQSPGQPQPKINRRLKKEKKKPQKK